MDDIFTKTLPKDKFCMLREMLGVKPTTSLEGSSDEQALLQDQSPKNVEDKARDLQDMF